MTEEQYHQVTAIQHAIEKLNTNVKDGSDIGIQTILDLQGNTLVASFVFTEVRSKPGKIFET